MVAGINYIERINHHEIDWDFVRAHQDEIVREVIVGGKYGSAGCFVVLGMIVAGIVALFFDVAVGAVLLGLGVLALVFPGKRLMSHTDVALRDHGRKRARLATAAIVMANPDLFNPPKPRFDTFSVFAGKKIVLPVGALVTEDPALAANENRLRDIAIDLYAISFETPEDPELQPVSEQMQHGHRSSTDRNGNLLPAVYLPESLTGNRLSFHCAIRLAPCLIPDGYLSESAEQWTGRFPVIVARGLHQVRVFFVPYWYWNEQLYRTVRHNYPRHEFKAYEGLDDPLPPEAADWPVVSVEEYARRHTIKARATSARPAATAKKKNAKPRGGSAPSDS